MWYQQSYWKHYRSVDLPWAENISRPVAVAGGTFHCKERIRVSVCWYTSDKQTCSNRYVNRRKNFDIISTLRILNDENFISASFLLSIFIVRYLFVPIYIHNKIRFHEFPWNYPNIIGGHNKIFR